MMLKEKIIILRINLIRKILKLKEIYFVKTF